MSIKNSLYLIILLLIFISGFLLGNKMDKVGRYQSSDLGVILDTKTGIFYIKKPDKDIVVVLDMLQLKKQKYKTDY